MRIDVSLMLPWQLAYELTSIIPYHQLGATSFVSAGAQCGFYSFSFFSPFHHKQSVLM